MNDRIRADALERVLLKAAKQGGETIDMNSAYHTMAPSSSAGIMQRLKDAARYVVGNVTPQTWLGPFQPLRPLVDDPAQGAVGRQFDFPVGFNTRITPRGGEGITFPMLRAFGDNYDLLRLAIETCKDQVESFDWEIVPEDPTKDTKQFAGEVKRVSDFLQYPDKEHNWSQWLRMFMEDVLVIDAVAIYPTKTRGGGIYSLDLVDGATIKRVIDAQGRTPMPPDPAYQQVLHGMPAVDYTREELVYMVRNLRTNRLYGYSPVEQVLMTVNIAMRRQARQLDEYTEGTVPEALISLPDAWTSQQIRDFQDWMDTILTGNEAARRKMRFIPKTESITFPKQAVLKDDYDEWLARIICWALSISPNALIKQMNRAASEQIAESAKEEGQMPRLRWFAVQMNYLLKQTVGMNGVKFQWKLDRSIDPLQQAQIDGIYLQNGIRTGDMQERLGLGDGGDGVDVNAETRAATMESIKNPQPLPGAVPAPQNGGKPNPNGEDKQPSKADSEKPAVAQKLGKAAKSKTVVASYVAKKSPRAARRVANAMEKAAESIIQKMVARYSELTKATQTEEEIIQKIMDELDAEGFSVEVIDELTPEILKAFKEGGATGLVQVDVKADGGIVNQLDKEAAAYAEQRAAQLVTAISKATEDRLRSVIADAVRSRPTADSLAKSLEDSYTFDEARAMTIARTELAFAHVQGNVAGWKQSGEVIGKRSLLGDLHDIDDVCDDAAEAGVVGVDEDFVPGYAFPPYHPNCFLAGTNVAAIGVTGQMERRFEGKVVSVGIEGVDGFTVTPNHPILTRRGWIAAGKLQVGDDVFYCADPSSAVAKESPNDHQVSSRIENLSASIIVSPNVFVGTLPTSAEDFHGDGIANSEVYVVRSGGDLSVNVEPCANEVEERFSLGGGIEGDGGSSGGGIGATLLSGDISSSDSSMSSGGIGSAPFRSAPDSDCAVLIGDRAQLVAGVFKRLPESGTFDTDAICDLYPGLTGHIRCVKIIHISDHDFSGHVYNVSTKVGWYFANGIISHNCLCDIVPVLSDEDNDTEE